MSAYDLFRSSAPWQPSLGDSEIPGVPNLGPEQQVPVRVIDKTRTVAGDRVSNLVVWTLPEHAVKAKDRLAGGEVIEVDAAKAPSGAVLYWISYVVR